MAYPLHELKSGERAKIVWVISELPMSLWLEELGSTAAAQMACILKGRRGHTSVYQIQGTVITLRPQNTRKVLVRVLNPGRNHSLKN